MRIDTAVPLYTPVKPLSAAAEPAPTAPSALPDPTNPEPPAPTTPEQPAEPTFSRAHGMLRKLVAGGFNPVAAARHAEKFGEELKAAGIDLAAPTHSKGKLAARYTPAPSEPGLDTAA